MCRIMAVSGLYDHFVSNGIVIKGIPPLFLLMVKICTESFKATFTH